MASISDLHYNTLLSTKKSHFRLQTVRDANDILSNAIADLPIFKHYNISEHDLFGGVDGQKYISQSHTLKSRYVGSRTGALI